MDCRPGCAACCIAPSISSSLPKHPNGKPAGVACLHLDDQGLCELFNMASRPRVCIEFQASVEICGQSAEQALLNLEELERLTSS